MNCLVTGGAGFIGSNLVDALLAEGHTVIALDDLSTGKLSNLEHLAGEERFRFVNGTVLDATLVDGLVSSVDLVYHLAAAVGVAHIVRDPLHCIRTNVGGSEIVLEASHRHSVATLVASSSEVYGKNASLPWSEDEDILLGPTRVSRWSYALTKALDEHLALAYASMGLPVSVVRYFNSYGPRLDAEGYGSVIARFISQARKGLPLTVYGDGRQTRCFTYVDDTVRGTILAATVPRAAGRVFNIGSDREMQINDLAEQIRRIVGSGSEVVHVPLRQVFGADFEETRRRVPDVRRAAGTLGFRAQVPLETGLRHTIEWFERSPL